MTRYNTIIQGEKWKQFLLNQDDRIVQQTVAQLWKIYRQNLEVKNFDLKLGQFSLYLLNIFIVQEFRHSVSKFVTYFYKLSSPFVENRLHPVDDSTTDYKMVPLLVKLSSLPTIEEIESELCAKTNKK